jgi:predicted phage-related endonuclease
MGSIALKSEAEWLAVRESFVGGSEIACLFYQYTDGESVATRHLYEGGPDGAQPLGCVSPYKTGFRLWSEKAGAVMPDDLSENERIQAGKHLEPALAAWAAEKFDLKLRKVRRYHQHDSVEGWGASLDYKVHGPGMPPVEFKNVDWLVFRDDWAADGETILAPPLHINLQLQHQIGAVGAEHGYIIACVGGNDLKIGKIARHEPTQTKIAEAITAFWEGVKAGLPPALVADYESVAKLFARGDKNAAARDLSDVEAFPKLCAEYLALKEQVEKAETARDIVKGQIAVLVGDATRATAPGVRISWPVVERQEKMIPASIQRALTYRGGLTVKVD